jgi:Protein of unknown function (DUF2934)
MPAPAQAKQPVTEVPSLTERIRQRAYELYLQRGNGSGAQLDDWLRAEAQIVRENAIDEASEESFPASDPPAR